MVDTGEGKLVFKYKGRTNNEDFSKFDNTFVLIDKIRDDEISLNGVKDGQVKLNSTLAEIKKVPKNIYENKIRKQKQILKNLRNARKAATDFFNEYTSRASEARRQAKKGTGLKILTPKKMLRRLPITLAQIKAGNNSQSLLNEIGQIVYSLYQEKPITKKVYNNMIKSIRV